MNAKTLSHADAVKELYRLAPHSRDYDEFMHVGARWLPYTMYFHYSNFKSPTINTDALGFRYSHKNESRFSVAELPAETPINLLVGGSTALGVGSTHDKYTASSYLSQETGEIWLNFSGRGYNSIQELLLFLMHQDKFKTINNIVILSGMNTLVLEGIPDHLSSDHGRYYYSFEFQHYMNKYNDDMKRKVNTYGKDLDSRSSLSKKIKSLLSDGLSTDNPVDLIITDEGTNLEDRIARAANVITKSLYQWSLLLKPFQSSFHFVLQPMAYWIRDYLTKEEQDIFFAIDHCPNNFWRLYKGILGKEVHQPFYQSIKNKCDKFGINCHDMSALLTKSPFVNRNLFVDRVHFNDYGYSEVARLIKEHVLH